MLEKPKFPHFFSGSANLNNIVGAQGRPSQNSLQWHIDYFALKLLKKWPLCFPESKISLVKVHFLHFGGRGHHKDGILGEEDRYTNLTLIHYPKPNPYLYSSLIKLPKPKCCCPDTNLSPHKFVLLSKIYKSTFPTRLCRSLFIAFIIKEMLWYPQVYFSKICSICSGKVLCVS